MKSENEKNEKAERLLLLAARHSYGGEIARRVMRSERWIEARAAYGIVGLNKPGLTRRLAESMRRWNDRSGQWQPVEVDTVERLAHAYELFVFLLGHPPAGLDSRAVRKLRRSYPYTRFALLWHAWKKYEIEPDMLYDALEMNNSDRAMMAMVEDAEHPMTENQRRARRVYAEIVKIRDDFDDNEIRLWAKEGIRLFEKKGMVEL